MLAQVTYIQTFIMADSEDEFMPIYVAASAAFVAIWICWVGVGRRAISNIFDTAGRRRAGIGRCHDFWNSHNRCPADALRHPADAKSAGRPAGLVSSRLKRNPSTQCTLKQY